MIDALICTLILVPSLLGWGVLANRLVFSRAGENIGEMGLLGLLALGFVAGFINLFVGITPQLATVLHIAGWLFIFTHRKDVSIYRVILAVAVGVAILPGALSFFTSNDMGGYHLPVVFWARDGALPFGLANVHIRFGFNSFWFYTLYGLSLPGMDMTAVTLSSALITGFFLLALFEQRSIFAILVILFVGLVAKTMFFETLGTTSTDLPAAIFTLYAFSLAFQKVTKTSEISSQRILLYSLASILIKLSQLPLFLLVFVVSEKNELLKVLRDKRFIISVFGISILWITRGVIQSGCLLFPALFTCGSFLPWTVPSGLVLEAVGGVNSFARIQNTMVAARFINLELFDGWLNGLVNRPIFQVQILLTIMGLFFLAVAKVRNKLSWSRANTGTVGVALMGVVFWFVQAPDVRFGWGFLTALPLLLISLSLQNLFSELSARARTQVSIIALVLYFGHGFFISHISGSLWVSNWPVIPEKKALSRVEPGGLVIYYPESGSDCWNLPRPCVHQYRPNLSKAEFLGRTQYFFSKPNQ